MNILLTGSQGYVGSGIIRSLGNTYNITQINRNIFDLRDSDLTKEWFSKLSRDTYFDVVIHCAVEGGSRLKEDDVSVLDNNLRMYYNLLNQKEHYNKFIHYSRKEKFCLKKFIQV